MEEAPIFRASKRRKHLRIQEEPPEDLLQVEEKDQQSAHGPNSRAHPESDDSNEETPSNGGVVRARKNFRRPVTGVSFSNNKVGNTSSDGNPRSSLVKATDESTRKPIDITDRFVSSTGQVVNVDQHMVAFIDSELAKRRNGQFTSTSVDQSHLNSFEKDHNDEVAGQQNHTSTPDAGQRISASDLPPPPVASSSVRSSINQLTEVDLGASTYETNLLRTKQALERARLGLPPLSNEPKPPKPRKPRIGRDGKPMKPRPPRKRRNSEDIARDALVESLLHENKFGIYEPPASNAQTSTSIDTSIRSTTTNTSVPTTLPPAGISNSTPQNEADADAEADDAVAEQFRQEFMDAMAERHHRHKASTQPKAPGGGGGGASGPGGSGSGAAEPKGPKLGGSRAARARMAQMRQQQQQQQGQGGGGGGGTAVVGKK